MTWRLVGRARHRRTTYAGDVLASVQRGPAHAAPRPDSSCSTTALTCDPQSRSCATSTTGEARCARSTCTEPHRRLVVTGRSLVETSPARSPSTVAGRAGTTSRADDTRDEFYEYLTAVVRTSRVRRLPRSPPRPPSSLPGRSRRGRGRRGAAQWTRDQLVYEPGATDVSTTASGALDLGRGVCQDFVHVAIALLRACGIPARYASGYLHPNDDALIGDTVTGQSHAWLEAWLGAWYAVDPTSGSEVGDRHVLVARGPRLRRRRLR